MEFFIVFTYIVLILATVLVRRSLKLRTHLNHDNLNLRSNANGRLQRESLHQLHL